MNLSRLPPLSALRAFAAYVQTGSVEQAGAALNVTHAAISQQLRGLETHMGLALLDRSGRSLRLTPEGQTLAQALLDGFGQIAAAVDALTGADAERPLMVSTTPTFAANWLMPRLAAFRAKHPGIDLMIDPTAEVKPLAPGGIDIALRYGAGDWPGLHCEPLVPSSIVVVAAPSLIGTDPVTNPKDLENYHWLQELGTSEASQWFVANGLSRVPGKGMTVLPGNMMMEAARQGQGVAIVAGVFVAEDVRLGRLRLLFSDGEDKGYHIVTRPGVMRPPLRDFTAWLRREASRNRALPEGHGA